MQALAGLGNPGDEYARTRHNAGYLLLDRLIAAGRVLERRDKEWVALERLQLGPDALWLLRPATYMNLSGLGVAEGCRSLQVEPGRLLVAYDDVDLPLGTIRIRRGGGSGGHRGMESIIEQLGSKQFPRLRLGVKGDRPWRDTAGYVLAEFEADERERLEDMLERALGAVRMILRRGLGTAMNHYNQKPPTEDDSPGSHSAGQDEASRREDAATVSSQRPDKESLT